MVEVTIMIIWNSYTAIIRIMLIAITLYYLLKRDFKKIKSTVLVIALTFLPPLLDYFFDLRIDPVGGILYDTVIVVSLYLGSTLGFYDRYAWWDRMLHLLAGAAFVSLGIAMADKVNDIGRFGILLFSFTLSNTLHIFWEVAEYIVDYFFHSNAQRWQKHHPTNGHQPQNAPQPPGLVDTMNDFIFCLLGAGIACCIWWFAL